MCSISNWSTRSLRRTCGVKKKKILQENLIFCGNFGLTTKNFNLSAFDLHVYFLKNVFCVHIFNKQNVVDLYFFETPSYSTFSFQSKCKRSTEIVLGGKLFLGAIAPCFPLAMCLIFVIRYSNIIVSMLYQITNNQ